MIKDDLSDQVQQLNDFVEQIQEQKRKLQDELNTAGDYLLEQEEKTNKANQALLDLVERLVATQEEIQKLKDYIVKLEGKKPRYMHLKGDKIDEALAEYINKNKGSMEVMFVRVDPGVYEFGTKRICVKADQGKLSIRVGGGYMEIEKFLE